MFLSGFSPILLLVITLIDSVVYGLYSTYYIRKYIKAESGYYLKNAVVCAFVCLIICAVEKFSFCAFGVDDNSWSIVRDRDDGAGHSEF